PPQFRAGIGRLLVHLCRRRHPHPCLSGRAQAPARGERMMQMLRNREKRFNLVITLVLLALSIFFILPLYWTAVFATRTLNEVFQFPPPLWFGDNIVQNYRNIEAVFPPFRPILNSL